MKKTFGILAHVDAGKTTFSEQILYHTKAIRNRGRVDHKDTFLDHHQLERQRGITIFSSQALFQIEDDTYYLIDTPGHMDFSGEMERAIDVMDYAVIIISGVDGIQGHTETVWRLLRQYNKPVFLFINKMDRIDHDYKMLLKEIKKKLSMDIIDITGQFKEDKFSEELMFSEELIEWVASKDEELLEVYFDTGFNKDLWLKTLKRLIHSGECFPCLSGSALMDQGVEEFLEYFHKLTETDYGITSIDNKDSFSGRVYKIKYDEAGNRLTFIKSYSGVLKVKDEVSYKGDEDYREKVNQIFLCNGNKLIRVDSVEAGDIFAVTGLTETKAGMGAGSLDNAVQYHMEAALKARVLYDSDIPSRDMLQVFKKLEAEDPMLKCVWDEELAQIHVNIMGSIQLEILKELVEERFHYKIAFAEPEVRYKETISGTVKGYGHFEPLRHYAEVALRLEAGERNSGIEYSSACHVDQLSSNYQNLIRTHVFEREHRGILTGSPITDLKIILENGIAHIKHTEGGDFREAVYRAIRQALEKAENILLEPYYAIRIESNYEYLGKILSDLTRLHGSFDTPLIAEDQITIIGRGPVASFMNFGQELASYTKGKGRLTLNFDGYDLCHNSNEIIEKRAYDKGADIKHTSCSVFCAKGTSFVVNWDEAEAYMHTLK